MKTIPILKKIILPILLFHVLSIAFFLSADLAEDKVLQDPVRYAADDGVYHMRLVENTLLGDHFPSRIYFDPFTNFPHGSYIHFAPLYTFLIAGAVWLFSLGQPTLDLINQIAPFIPPILGCATILTIFFIGKVLWNKWIGLLAAFLMAFCQPFLFRSLLGATDHHQAETLFSSLTMLFLILALKNKDGKSFWPWSILAGIGLGLYFLVWNGALLFLFIIFTALLIYCLINHFLGRKENRILAGGGLMFFIAFLMILPFAGHPDIFQASLYDLRHYGSLILALVGLAAFRLSAKLSDKTNRPWTIVPILALLGLSVLGLLKVAFEPMLSAIIESFQATKIGMVGHELSRELIGEMKPLTAENAFKHFGYLFYFSFLGLILIIYNFLRKKKPEDILIATWFLIIAIMTGVLIPAVGQTRFVYYFSANICLFGALLIFQAIRLTIIQWQVSESPEKQLYLKIGSAIIAFNLIFFLFYPFPFEMESKMISRAVENGISSAVQQPQDWYDTLEWIKENTPDPGLDYYALYQEPKFNKEKQEIEPYAYPETAYGILASWDFGHILTYYAKRLPIANPFQQGVGRVIEGEVIPGEATFFIENDQEKAISMLDELKAKYVITDYRGADAWLSFRPKQRWAIEGTGGYYFEEGENKGKPTQKYYQSMAPRLHYLDGSSYQFAEPEEFSVDALKYFRLIYESKSDKSSVHFQEEPCQTDRQAKMVKVFERVAGAKIKGAAPEGSLVEFSCEITTNQERKFIYRQSAKAVNGYFEIISPYSTENKTPAVSVESCQLEINGEKIKINISEEEVIKGLSIKIK